MSDIAAALNAIVEGWNHAMGLRFVEASADEVVAELEIAAEHRQPYGIVHGGVYSGIIETVCSTGAAIDAAKRNQSVVGMENHTSFLRAVREGTLRVVAKPLSRGSRTQVWEATVFDGSSPDARAVASGRVRLLALEPGATLAGGGLDLRPPKE